MIALNKLITTALHYPNAVIEYNDREWKIESINLWSDALELVSLEGEHVFIHDGDSYKFRLFRLEDLLKEHKEKLLFLLDYDYLYDQLEVSGTYLYVNGEWKMEISELPYGVADQLRLLNYSLDDL